MPMQTLAELIKLLRQFNAFSQPGILSFATYGWGKPGKSCSIQEWEAAHKKLLDTNLLQPPRGDLLNGNLLVLDNIGDGGQASSVMLACDLSTMSLRVLKAVDADPAKTARLNREHRIGQKINDLKHQNLVHTHQIFDGGCGSLYLVLDHVGWNDGDGIPTSRTLSQEIRQRGRLPVQEALNYLIQICSAVSVLHAMGLIHRDIKPSNIGISKVHPGILRAPATKAVLFDYGLVRDLTIEAHPYRNAILAVEPDTAERTKIGTEGFTDPLVYNGERADFSSDIYALGTVFIAMLGFRVPGNVDPASLNVSSTLRQLLSRSMSYDRKCRPASVDQFVECLCRCDEAPPALARYFQRHYPSSEIVDLVIGRADQRLAMITQDDFDNWTIR